ncbi:hypothetical protein UPYG_G00222820 [Umbra pygmaea]|uniref:MutL homolog 3 n=1 Tax=Umbra pygmaea TaxID=75934 RepID=A0ABD0WBV6_UMBPY
MIKYLSKDVQENLRSGIAICSLQQCLEELIMNSIDAGATCVSVRVDMEAFKVQVIDNGSGMDLEVMEHVGKRYFTSKCSSLEDLDNLKFYGFRGEALASIASLAVLVEISSRTKMSVKTHVKIFKNGKGLDVFESETTRPSAGTTVIICNFLHNMPVRRKRMVRMLEFEQIKQRLEAVSLMHPTVSFTLKSDCTGTMVVQLSKAQNTYYRFVQIHGLARAQKLREIRYSHAQFEVNGYIGRDAHYNSTLQFLFVNDRLLLKTRIHKLLNLLLRKAVSSSRQSDSPGYSASKSPKQRRGTEFHAMYVINIKCPYSEYDVCLEPAKSLIEFKAWESVLFCIEEAVKEFLKRENLVCELSSEDIQDYVSQNAFIGQTFSTEGGNISAEQGAHSHTEGGNISAEKGACSHTEGVTLYIGMTLASEAVHRRYTEDVCKIETVCQTSNKLESEGDETKINSDGEVRDGGEAEPEHNTTNAQSQLRSDDTHRESQYVSKMHALVQNSSTYVSYKDIGNENKPPLNTEHLKMERTKINCTATMEVLLSRCTEGALQSVSLGFQSETGTIKQTATQLPDTEHDPGEHRIIFITDPYIHNSSTSPKCTSNKHRKILVLESEGKIAAKRKCPIVLGQGQVNISETKRNFPTYITSKDSKLISCQKLALYKEAGSLDKFRRIYGKCAQSKPLPVDNNSNNFAIGGSDSWTRIPVMNGKAVIACDETNQESDVTESCLNKKKDHKNPVTVPLFTKCNPLPAQSKSKRTSLASKCLHLKHKRTENTSVHPPVAFLNEDIPVQVTVLNSDLLDINNEEINNDTSMNPDFIPSCCSNPPIDEEGQNNVTATSDWLPHYDDAGGKLVYINRVTGLSRYEAPPSEEMQVCCTSDITNMAVSVVSKTGIEYRCYPFQVDQVLPFLPKSKPGRELSSGPYNGDDLQNSNSLSSLYSEWTNPVFSRPPVIGVDISSGQAEGLAVKIHNILFPYRFSKEMIHSMKERVIQQVDKKFLACLINTQDQVPAACSKTDGNLLVLVDQHAAHERVRLEHLVADSYKDNPEAAGQRLLCSSTVSPPLQVSVTEEDLRLLRSCQPFWRALGLHLQFSQTADHQVLVRKVPMCFTEKESNELRRGKQSVIKPLVEEYLQEQIEYLRSTGSVRRTLPLTVLKVLASLACHGAIKFNDSLSREECCSLVGSLSSCQLPFQCAHGRPSIAPLVDISHLNDQEEPSKPNLRKLRRMYKAWVLYGKK